MNDQKRRFRPRPQRNGFRPRNNGGQNSNGHFQSGGNGNISRNNGSMTNPFNVEKAVHKYQQLAKDAQSNGDPVLAQNYLQHADHYLRRYNELNERRENSNEKTTSDEKSLSEDKTLEKETQQTSS